MTKPSGWTGVRVLAAMVVVAASGCGRARPGAGDTAASAARSNASTALTVGAARAGAASGAAALPGALTKPLAQYTGDQLYALAHTLTFTGGVERQRRCRGNAGCRGSAPTQFTRMRVDAVSGEDSLSARGLPGNGVIAARALNRGQFADSLYDTQPGAYEYYLVVLPGAADTAVWRLEQVGTAPGVRSLRTIGSGTLHECGHPFVPGARADFKTCAQAALVHRAAFHVAPQGDPTDPPIWFSCALGCCTVDPSASS